MIRKLLLSKQNYKQLIPVLFGSFFGLLMLLTSLQMYFQLDKLMNRNKDLISAQYIVLNKPVNIFNSITGKHNSFSKEEIEKLKSIQTVEALGLFTSNRFRVQAGFEFSGATMLTDMFFESVSDEFLDIKVDHWLWKPGDEIPIVLPTDYLNLYNFGFAPVQNLPQISKSTAQMAGLKILISNKDTQVEFQGRIAGFTDRINSVLVPETFMVYANHNYGFIEITMPSRLVIKAKNPTDIILNECIEKNGYEINQELNKNGKLNSLLRMVLGMVLFIGFIIIMLAFIGFIQYAQLLINHSSFEIKTLLHLGYEPYFILKKYFLFYIGVMALVGCSSFICLYFINGYASEFVARQGFEFSKSIFDEVWIALFGLIMIFIVLNTVNTYRILIKYAKPT